MRLSASRLDTWMKCQAMAKFRYRDRLPEPRNAAASFGTIIHECLEDLSNGAPLSDVLDKFKDMWDNPPSHLVPQVWPRRSSTKKYRDAGIAVLTRYAENLDWNRKQLLGTEVGFLVPIGRHWLHGYIDDLSIMGGRKGKSLVVTDHKTNAKQPYANQLRMNQQFTVYGYAVNHEDFWTGQPQEVIDEVFQDYAPEDRPEITGVENGEYWKEMTRDLPIQLHWHHVMTGNTLDCGQRTMEDYERLLFAIDMIEAAMEADAYVPSISGDTCGFCSFTKACGVPIDDVLNYNPAMED
jgi:hypothetical protein